MPCPLCQQQNRAVLLPKSPQTSQKFPKTPMSSVRSCLGHSTCGSRKKSYHVHTRKASTSLCRRQKLHIAQQCFTADAIRRFTLVGKSQPILTSRRSGVQPDRSAQLQPTRKERYRTAGRVLPRSPRGDPSSLKLRRDKVYLCTPLVTA